MKYINLFLSIKYIILIIYLHNLKYITIYIYIFKHYLYKNYNSSFFTLFKNSSKYKTQKNNLT